MGKDNLMPPFDVIYRKERHDFIKKKYVMVQNWLDLNEAYLPIMIYPIIIICITPYIGNQNYWFCLIHQTLGYVRDENTFSRRWSVWSIIHALVLALIPYL